MGICSSESEAPVNPNCVDASHFSMMKVVGQGGFGKVNAVNNRVSGALLAMKRMKKTKLIQKPIYVSTAWRERDVMSKVKSKFLVNLNCSFQDERYLYVIMPFMQGGDLRYYMNTKGRMDEEMVRFYMAEILLGLEELHELHIAYRDLKPDNVLFDALGHVRISDFGLAVFLRKEDNYLTAGTAGTPGYQAPEVMERGSMYGTSADVYSFGVMLFELLQNVRPYQVGDESNAVPPSQLIYDYEVSAAAKDIIEHLLERDPSKRLGCGKEGLSGIKHHAFFNSIDWEKVAAHHPDIIPPFQPDVTRANCSGDFELHEQFFGDEDKEEPLLTENQQKNFEGFEFNTEFSMPADGLKKTDSSDA